jgi:hypothetical protein
VESRIPFIAAAVAFATLASGEARANLSDGGHYGTVVDAADGRPVADAKVVALWHVAWSGLATSGERCVKIMVVDADKEGRFHLPPWSAPDTAVVGFDLEAHAHKAGYRVDRGASVGGGGTWTRLFGLSGSMSIAAGPVSVLMRRDAGTPAERGRYLLEQVPRASCFATYVSSGVSYFFVKSLYDEMLTLPPEVQQVPVSGTTSIGWLWRTLQASRNRLMDEDPGKLDAYPPEPSPLPPKPPPRDIRREAPNSTYPSAR